MAIGVMFSPMIFGEDRLRMATTTSTENSGLLAILHPVFEEKYNMKLDVIAVGTGKALRLGENGDVDLILVHAPEAEKKFMQAGFGLDRKAVMHNDFVIIGPVGNRFVMAQSAAEVLREIADQEQIFISRGDDSGTHKKENSLWAESGVIPSGKWYLATGQGMGAVIKIADDKQAYTLVDRGTWLAYRNKVDLQLIYEGDPALFNPYHVIAINPARHAHVKSDLVDQYIQFITGKQGQELIGNFKVEGELLFHPDALKQ